MVELVNKVTGGRMWVAEDRVDEYLAAGHKKPAATAVKPTEAKKPTRRTKKG